MQDKKIIHIAKIAIGSNLKSIRKEKGISKYSITQTTGLKLEMINSIEEGSKAYTIDTFLTYIGAIDCYFYLAPKDGKHLDFEDLAKKSKEIKDQN